MQMQEAGPSPTSAGRVPRGEPGNGATHAGARQADAPGRSVTSPDIAWAGGDWAGPWLSLPGGATAGQERTSGVNTQRTRHGASPGELGLQNLSQPHRHGTRDSG